MLKKASIAGGSEGEEVRERVIEGLVGAAWKTKSFTPSNLYLGRRPTVRWAAGREGFSASCHHVEVNIDSATCGIGGQSRQRTDALLSQAGGSA